jgi:hypothetical protein
VFFVRSGGKPVEFEKGKSAIAIPSLDKVPAVIDTLIAAVRAGDLDDQLAQAMKAVGAKTRKAARIDEYDGSGSGMLGPV